MKKIEFTIHSGGVLVDIELTEEKKELIIERIFKYMKDNNCASGETLHQDDDCIIDAPSVLSDIIDDILKPNVKYIG